MKKIIAILILVATLCLAGCNTTENKKFIKVTVDSNEYYGIRGVEQELGCTIIVDEPIRSEETDTVKYSFTIDTAYADVMNDHVMDIGVKYLIMSYEEFEDIQKYQNETGNQVLYPTVYYKDRPTHPRNKSDGNIYFVTKDPDSEFVYPEYDENGKFIPNYWKYDKDADMSSLIPDYNSLRIEGFDGFVGEDGKTYLYVYGRKFAGDTVEVRANLHEYQAYRDYLFGNTNEN